MKNRLLCLLIAAFMLTVAGCDLSIPSAKTKHEEAKTTETEPLKSKEEVFKQLPCFGCHKIEGFLTPLKGKFPHPKHIGLDVHCNQCHEPHGHIPLVINKAVCDKCHKLTDFSFEGGGAGKVVFSHNKHTKKFGCSECHAKTFNMKRGLSKMTMETMDKGSGCGTCHNGKKAFETKSCNKCHTMSFVDFSYEGGGVGKVVFSHNKHIKKLVCADCHPKVFTMKKGGNKMIMDEMNAGKSCGTCHNGKKAFEATDCGKCHNMG